MELELNDQHLLEADEQINEKIHRQNINLTLQNLTEAQYVAQFLELEKTIVSHRSQDQELSSNNCLGTNLQRSTSQICREAPKLENLPKKPKIKSIFHNFQKHLVITLRRDIKMKKNLGKSQRESLLISRMWELFVNSCEYTKKELYLLFGVAKQDNRDIIEKLKETTSEEISQSFTFKEILDGQAFFRNQVAKQGRKLLFKNLFKNRRIEKSQEFKMYLQKFIEQIEAGQIRKRLSKNRKNELLEQMPN